MFHALEDEVDAVLLPSFHPVQPRQNVLFFLHALLGPLDGDVVVPCVGLHPTLVVIGALPEHLGGDGAVAQDLPEEVHHLFGSHQPGQVAIDDDAVEAMVDELQELAEHLVESVHRYHTCIAS